MYATKNPATVPRRRTTSITAGRLQHQNLAASAAGSARRLPPRLPQPNTGQGPRAAHRSQRASSARSSAATVRARVLLVHHSPGLAGCEPIRVPTARCPNSSGRGATPDMRRLSEPASAPRGRDAHAHDIQRLMVLGQFLPDRRDRSQKTVQKTGISRFMPMRLIGSRLPNAWPAWWLVAHGGMLATKPYAASGNYINKMSRLLQRVPLQGQREDRAERFAPSICSTGYFM